MDDIYQKLVKTLTAYAPNADLARLERAYRYAEEQHEGQKRKSGEP